MRIARVQTGEEIGTAVVSPDGQTARLLAPRPQSWTRWPARTSSSSPPTQPSIRSRTSAAGADRAARNPRLLGLRAAHRGRSCRASTLTRRCPRSGTSRRSVTSRTRRGDRPRRRDRRSARLQRPRPRTRGRGDHRPRGTQPDARMRRARTSPATRSSTTGRRGICRSPRCGSGSGSARARTSPTRSVRGSSPPTSSSRIATATASTSTLRAGSTVASSATTRWPTWPGASRSWSSYASRGAGCGPGDVLGSGTCGSGCLLELRGRHGRDAHPAARGRRHRDAVSAGDRRAHQHDRHRGRAGPAACGPPRSSTGPRLGMRIDCHAHVHPPAYRKALGPLPLPPTDLGGLEASMERYEIDAAVISVGPPGAFIGDAIDPAELRSAGQRRHRRGRPRPAAPVRGACHPAAAQPRGVAR